MATLMDISNNVDFQIILEGYNQAYGRFLEARSRARSTDSRLRLYIPLLETLGWADVIEERLKQDRGENWVLGLPARYHQSKDIILGYRYIRNIVHHDWVLAIELDDEPGILQDWRWKRGLVAQLKQKKNESAYSRRMAGRALRHTFKDLHSLYSAISSEKTPK